MVRILLIALLFLTFNSFSQDRQGFAVMITPPFRYEGVFSASATYAPGFMLNRDQTNFHLNAFGEYHINRKVSVKSDSYWFLNSPNEKTNELQMLRSHFGLFYHFNKNYYSNWDFKIGAMPGMTYSRQVESVGDAGYVRMKSFAPSVSIAAGFDYYVWKYFHFFSQVSYVNSTARGLLHGSQRMDEIIVSAGLGFQIPTMPNRDVRGGN